MPTFEAARMWLGLLLLLNTAEFPDWRLPYCPRHASDQRVDWCIWHHPELEFFGGNGHPNYLKQLQLLPWVGSFALLSHMGVRSPGSTRAIRYPLSEILLRGFQQPKTVLLLCWILHLTTSFIWLSCSRQKKIHTLSTGWWPKRQNPKPLKDSSCQEIVYVAKEAARGALSE